MRYSFRELLLLFVAVNFSIVSSTEADIQIDSIPSNKTTTIPDGTNIEDAATKHATIETEPEVLEADTLIQKTPLTPSHLLDEEIETLRELIQQYDAKISLLEDREANQATSVNSKGKREPYGQVKLTTDADQLYDFYQFRIDTETTVQ